MNKVWSNDIDLILSRGQPLDDLGIRNWALERNEALAALALMESLEAGVLGGDVYVRGINGIELNYDSWYCDRDDEEADASFARRSVAKARDYISRYKPGSMNFLFSIVPDILSK